MIPKQDRQGVRKAMDIEQKYDLNTDFSKIEKIASSALITAEKANSNVSSLDKRVVALEESESGIDLGLSIVDGKLCITYKQDEVV